MQPPLSKMTKAQLLGELRNQDRSHTTATIQVSQTPAKTPTTSAPMINNTAMLPNESVVEQRTSLRNEHNLDFGQSVRFAGAFHSFGKDYLSEFMKFHKELGDS